MNYLNTLHPNPQYANESIRWINIAKGLGIILVVVGHFNPGNAPQFWQTLNTFIYTFHMPLFFFISGYLYKHSEGNYINNLKIKIQRLGIPFITIALVFFFVKFISGYFVTLDFPVNIHSIVKLLDNPMKSYVPLLWFVHALIGIFLIYPIIRSIFNACAAFSITLTTAIFIHGININTPFFSHAIQNMPYFALGVVCMEIQTLKNIDFLESEWTFLSLFIVMIIFSLIFRDVGTFSVTTLCIKYFQGILGIVSVVSLSMALGKKYQATKVVAIEVIGICSMSIYLFHTLFESAIRILFTSQLSSLKTPFLMIALLAVMSGLFLPMVIEIAVLRKSKLLSLLFLGLKLPYKRKK